MDKKTIDVWCNALNLFALVMSIVCAVNVPEARLAWGCCACWIINAMVNAHTIRKLESDNVQLYAEIKHLDEEIEKANKGEDKE